MRSRGEAIVTDALAALDVRTEAALRAMLPLAGRLDCPRCSGAGAILGPVATTITERGFTLERPITRCTCVTITRPGVPHGQ